jgi:hypothetical protein
MGGVTPFAVGAKDIMAKMVFGLWSSAFEILVEYQENQSKSKAKVQRSKAKRG